MNQVSSDFHINKILQIASELKYQLPLTRAEFADRGCDCCGAPARFPGPCVECAERELARLIGADQARKWTETCREQQRLWKSFADCAAAIDSQSHKNGSLRGKGMLDSLLRTAAS